MRDSIQKVNAHVSADSLILAQRIYTDSVVVMDTLHKYYATKDTLKNFVKKDALCTEVMACDDIQTMRDSIQKVNAHVSADSLVLAKRIVADSTILSHRMDTLLKHVCDSVKPCVTSWISDSTRMVFDTLHKYYTNLSTLADSMHKVDVRIKHDSLEVVELYKQAQTALQTLALTEKTDSLTLAHRMDTLLKHVCDSVKPCVTSWISDSTRMVFDTLHNRYTTLKTLKDSTTAIRGALVDTARNIRNSIGNGTLTIKQGDTELGTFNANQNDNKVIPIPVPTEPNDATLIIQKNGTTVGTFTANQATNNTINITVPTCDSLAECDLIKSILARLDKLERQNDSLAKEIEKMKPNLTVSANESVTVCSGSTLPVTYTATFHNCSSSDYTLAWKVNGVDSSAVTGAVLTLNVEEEGSYKVVCIATRSDNTSVTDTVITTVTVVDLPSFTAEVTNLTVSLTNVENTAIIQWDTDSVPVDFSGTSAEHTYSVADTITITATSENGCTFTKGLRLKATAPEVTTDSVKSVAATTAKAYGTVVSDGGVPETKRGMVYSTSDQNLELGADGVDTAMNGTGMGSYSCNLNRLVPCTQYYVRAFAFNEVDTVYGEVKNFTTPPFSCGSTLTDIDGNEYGTLLLGSQCWMQQNLRTTHFADGTEIPLGGLNNHSGPRRYAPDSNLDTYGYLYNWDAAMNGKASSAANPSGVQGACPDGWHLPSDAEWTQLTSFVASNNANVCENNPDNIAVSLASTEGWGTWGTCPTSSCKMCTNPASNNNTQFSVLPAGTWHVNAALGHINQGYAVGMAIFRTATVYEENYVRAREFYTENAYVDATAIDKTNGLSVRCVLTCPTDAAYLPTVSAVTLNATGATVSMTSNVLADGGATVTERGVCWSTSQHPTTSSTHKAASSAGTGSFTVSEDLTPGTTYYVRAYATNSEGTAYGAEVAYTTPMPKLSPTVNTGSKFIALMEGFEDSTLPSAWTTIDNDGDGNNWDIGSDPHSAGSQCILSRSWNGSALHPDNYLITPDISLPTGILSVLTFWHKGSGDPSFSNEQFMVKVGNIGASTVGDFTTLEPELTSSDEYVQKTVDLSSYAGQTIRLAFVHNDTDKEYLCIDDIVVGEDGAGDNIVSDVTATTATCGGYVSDDGGATVTARGVCWSTSPNPTVSDSHTTDGTGTGGFTSNITGLTVNTTYYVRAYAINSEGTTYGNQVSFKTLNRSLNITSDRAATIKMCGASSQTVTYTATPSNGDASDYTYSWSCSGGTISGTPTSNTATITYTSAATYTVSCTATHNTESFDISKTATTTVQSGGNPTYLGLCNEGLTITSHEEENNKNSRWAFANSISWGDGNSTTITSAQFSHTYAAPGIYTVTISSSGCDVNRTFALGDIVPHPCTVTNAHTNASTYTSSTGGLEAINAEGKVTTVADNDGNTYNVTQIGSQCWMAENLRTTKNPDGTTIAQGSSSTSSDASVAYRYDPVGGVSADPYGYFYNWTAVMNGESASSTNPSNVRGICPLGWHVPSAAEWDVMLTEVGTDKAAKLATGCDWKLDYSTLYYQAKSTPGDCAYPERNSTGFGALPAGTYIDANNYSKTAYFWTTDASSSSSAKFYYFGNATSSVQNNTTFIFNGYSLRCVRD